jgi:hypothetical protein
MSTATPSSSPLLRGETAASDRLHWRSWPLADHWRWSWVVPVGMLAIGGGAAYLSGDWLTGLVVFAVLAIALWQFFLPTSYEVLTIGIRIYVLGRVRLVPWQAVRAYRTLSSGVVLYQRPDPTIVDALRNMYLPYPPDADEMLCAVREHLGHAVELP